MDCAARVQFLHDVLTCFDYPKEQMLLAGSAAMHVPGILEPFCPRDLDVIVRDEVTWQRILMECQDEDVNTQGFSGVRVKVDYDGDGLEDIDGSPVERGVNDDTVAQARQAVIGGFAFDISNAAPEMAVKIAGKGA